MPYYATKEFRMNCKDKSKKQRIALYRDGVLITNENICVSNRVRFNLASMTSEQIKFGETPCNTISVPIFNEDGMYSRSDLLDDEFFCQMGVEVSGRVETVFPWSYESVIEVYNQVTDSTHKNVELIGLELSNVKLTGNIKLTNLPEIPAPDFSVSKMLYCNGNLYTIGGLNMNEYHVFKRKEPFVYEYQERVLTNCEKSMMNRLAQSALVAISIFDGYILEWKNTDNTVVPSDRKTWSQLSSSSWGDLGYKWHRYGTGYREMDATAYESVPMGMWQFDSPRRVRENIVNLTGRDRMKKFDVDSITYANNIGLTNISVRDQAITMSNYTGVPCDIPTMRLNTLANASMCNPSNYYSSKSIKDLLSYCFEVGANNAVIDRYGTLTGMNPSRTYPTYDTAPTVVGVDHFYTLDRAEATVNRINHVITLKQGDTVMIEDHNVGGETYDWNDNPFFQGNISGASWFSNDMDKKYYNYQPMIFSTDSDYTLWTDDIVPVYLDGSWKGLPIFSMTIEWSGTGVTTYEIRGTEHREIANYANRIQSVASTNDTNMQGLNKAQYNNKLYFDENGLTIESQGLRIKNNNGNVVFSADNNGNLILEGTVEADAGYIGDWHITEHGIINENETYGMELLDTGLYFRTTAQQPLAEVAYVENTNTMNVRINGSDAKLYLTASGGVLIQTDKMDMWGEIVSNSTSSPFTIKSNSIRCNSAIWQDNIPTTSSSANTCLVSGSYGYQINRITSLAKNKDNIKPIENAWETVDNIRGVQFTSKCKSDNPKTVYFGFIADEVEKVEPKLVSYNEKGELESVQYDRFTALLIEDNKECHRRIEELEEKLKKVEEKLDAIYRKL